MTPHAAAKLTLAASFMIKLASAHGGDGHSSMPSMTTMEGMTMQDQKPANATYPPTYFAHPEHSSLIYGHIALTVIAWVFFLPVAVVLSLTRSRFTLALQSVFLVLNGFSVFLAALYNAKTPDLYPNNAHHKIGWVITLVVCAHVFVNFIDRVASVLATRRARSSPQPPVESLAFLNSSSQSFENDFPPYESARHSEESFDAASPTAHSFRTSSASTAFDESAYVSQERFKEYNNEDGEGTHAYLPTLPTDTRNPKFSRVWKSILNMYGIVDRIILPFGFVAFTTGIVAFARFFEGHEIFSGLAHWIKGGVFFWLGLFNLGRWSGCFAEIGWAWNCRPRYRQSKSRWVPTAEFVESALILFYGSTNIFLEHLGNAGSAWSSQDLEHMSITVLFIGGGLCGILIESHSIRQLLNMNLEIAAGDQNRNLDNEERELYPPDTYNFSLNPIPALVILLLGMMMSSHQQSTMISSMVHKQWGNLLLGASVARGLTYVLLYLRPPSSIMPSRPPTELLSSFGLIAGGVIFMASSSDTIDGMIHYNLDAMFFYTVSMGCVALLMAWELIVLAIKGLSARSERRRSIVSRR